MLRIYSYPLEITDKQSIELPKNSLLMSVINHPGKCRLVAYVLLDLAEKKMTTLNLYIFGTGNPFETSGKKVDLVFINSVTWEEGRFIWHVFAEINRDIRIKGVI